MGRRPAARMMRAAAGLLACWLILPVLMVAKTAAAQPNSSTADPGDLCYSASAPGRAPVPLASFSDLEADPFQVGWAGGGFETTPPPRRMRKVPHA